jgi:hypothetical protein
MGEILTSRYTDWHCTTDTDKIRLPVTESTSSKGLVQKYFPNKPLLLPE